MQRLGFDACRRAVEQELLALCSPTLAGAKPASMCGFQRYHRVGSRPDGSPIMAEATDQVLDAVLRQVNAGTVRVGVRVEAFVRRRYTTLLYVHSPALFEGCVGVEPVATMLEVEDYDVRDQHGCLVHLRDRILSFDRCPRDETGRDRFPHEVGFFLGYPVDDVLAFVRQRGTGVLLRGCWNVYGDVERARATFDLYDALTSSRLRRYREGATFAELVG